jgi:hypothetical protein
VSWQTDPGPEDLRGYRLDKSRGDAEWFTLVSRTTETSYHDRDGTQGDKYRLFAVNGLGDQLYLGQTGDGAPPSLPTGVLAYPVPYSAGELTIAFATVTVGGAPVESEVAIYDVAGRRVKTVARGRFADAVGVVKWDGRDNNGAPVASGIYFVRVTTAQSTHVRKLVIVR